MRCSHPPFYIGSSLNGRGLVGFFHKRIKVHVQETFHKAVFTRSHSDLGAGSSNDDGRTRLSGLWAPTGGIAESLDEDSHSKLIRAGYLRQAHSGIFHMLPLGRRVQDKLEALIDKYMSKLNASKLSLSSITSEELWTKSGRLEGVGSELFRFKDRKDARYLLAPTHEEEITTLVSSTTTSYKELPIRLYQISRKYRDEKRPRQGLLRSREFIMKDLYTFDYSAPLALNTYRDVRKIYARLFDDLKIPYLVADADSGNMGGNLSHEFHFPTSKGEDRVISCSDCDYVANEELAEASVSEIHSQSATASKLWRGVSQDRKTLVNVWYSISDSLTEPQVNVHAVKSILPDLDAAVEDPLSLWEHHLPNEVNPSNILSTRTVHPQRILNLIDARVPQECQRDIQNQVSRTLPEVSKPHESDLIIDFVNADPSSGKPLNLLRISDGDQCNHCAKGKLKVQKAIELGHTFHLGARYSEPLNAVVTVPTNLLEDETTAVLDQVSDLNAGRRVPMQMGCHGIGVSRIIGAVADTLADSKGLNWPRVMAPYEVVVIPVKDIDSGALEVYDTLSIPRESSDHVPLDLILDDRAETFPWKMGDADLVGYPVIVVVGRRWKKERICEVQCRRLNVRQDVAVGNLSTFVDSLLCQL